MEENQKIYAIRHLSFWYTDEYYQPFIDNTHHAGHITDLFDKKEDAIQKWKQLEYNFSHQVNFLNIIYCEYSGRDDYDKKDILAKKSVDELFNIIQELECHAYGLYEYPKQLKQQVLFNTKSQQYYITDCHMNDDDINVNSNVFINANFNKNHPLINEIFPPIDDAYEHYIKIKGSLDELSNTPLLLQCLIKENPDIQHYETYLEVKFKDLPQVNALLKQPIEEELQDLTIEEIYQLEHKLNQTNPKGTEHP